MNVNPARPEVVDLAHEVGDILIRKVADVDIGRLRQIEVRVTRLRDINATDPGYAEMVLFLCAAAEGNRSKLERAAREAVRLSNGNREIAANAAVALCSIGNIDESTKLTQQIFEKFPDDKIVLETAISNFQLALHFREALSAWDAYERLAVNHRPKNLDRLRKIIVDSAEVIKLHGFTDSDLQHRLKVGIASLRKQGFEVRRQSRLTFDDGTFISQLFINATPKVCAEMNFEIAYALLDAFEDPAASVFSIVCRPFSDAAGMQTLELTA